MPPVHKVAGGRLYFLDGRGPDVYRQDFARAAGRRPMDRVEPPEYVAPSEARPGIPPREARPDDFKIGPRPGSLPAPPEDTTVAQARPVGSVFLNPQRYLTR